MEILQFIAQDKFIKFASNIELTKGDRVEVADLLVRITPHLSKTILPLTNATLKSS